MPDGEYKISFQEILNRAQVERKLDPSISQTASLLVSASYFEGSNDILERAREGLLKEDPRKLFMNCLQYIVKQIQDSNSDTRYLWVDQLMDMGIRGLGIKIDDLEFIGRDSKNVFRASPKWEKIEEHINNHVLGNSFLIRFSLPADNEIWSGNAPLRISSCDASQHRFKLTLPLFNKAFSTPIVVNNAAGIIKEKNSAGQNWIRVVVPKSTQDFENWVIVGMEQYTGLDENDYEWATKSAMDVGQFFVEESFIFTYGGSSKRPDVHLRDGTIFTQDHAMNCKLNNRHGELTREAIHRMVTTLRRADDLGILYCGVSKNVELKMYSIVVDYYIREVLGDKKWNSTRRILPDSNIMKYLLPTERFNAATFDEIYATCPVIRPFYVKSNLNSRTDKQVQNDLRSLENIMHTRTKTARSIVDEALDTKVAMFFVGHSNSDQFYVPRYEFVYYDKYAESISDKLVQILSAIRLATIDEDRDHTRKMDEPILVPLPLMYAHDLSKAMGDELVKSWTARTWTEYIRLRKENQL